MYRQSIIRSLRATSGPSTRLFTSNARLQKTATETVKDAAKTVDRKISDTLVGGIEKGEQAAAAAKSAANISSSEAKAKADELSGKASELAGEAKGKANQVAGEAKGKANEVAGEAQGKKEELKGEAKSKLS